MRICVMALVASLFVLCSTPQVSLTPVEPKAKIEAGKATVRVLEMRMDIAPNELVIPFHPFPGQNESQSAKLPANLESMLSERANACLTKSGTEIELQILVNKARKGWSAGVAKKAEMADVDLQITVVEPATGEELLISHAAVSMTRPTMSISVETLNEVYSATMVNALNKFLLNEEEVGILNANLKRFAAKPAQAQEPAVVPVETPPAATAPAVQDTMKTAPVSPAAKDTIQGKPVSAGKDTISKPVPAAPVAPAAVEKTAVAKDTAAVKSKE